MGLPRGVEAGPLAYEIKHFDTVFGTAVTQANNTFIIGGSGNRVPDLIFYPIEGKDDTERVGRRTQVIAINIHAKLDAALQGAFTFPKDYRPHLVRFIIFVDNQVNGVKPNASDLLENPVDPHWTTSGAGTATDATKYPIHAYCLRNLDNKDRFRILYDKAFMMGGSSTVANLYIGQEGKSSYLINKRIECNVDTIFNSGSAATIADIQTGAIFYLCLGTFVTGTSDPTVTGKIRVDYLDA